jgi:pSer/pThr/pTyr-binding forkhead associated (FHA) protein
LSRDLLSPKEERTDRSAKPVQKPKEKNLIQRLMNPNGRVDYEDLKEIAEETNEQQFVQRVRYHCLLGVTILQGEITDDPNDQNETKLYDPDNVSVADRGRKSFDLSKVIFPLAHKGETNNDDQFNVGRGDDNDIIISDYSISREHLTISLGHRGRYYLKNRGSKNATLVGETICENKEEVEIVGEDLIRIGRYQFIFLAPGMLYAHLKGLNVQRTFKELVDHLGKADYKALKEVADRRGESVFKQLVHNPALVGVGLFKGYLVDSNSEDDDETKLFLNKDREQQQAQTMLYLTRNIFPIFQRDDEDSNHNFLSIGRTQNNDLCMADNSISRSHAQIRLAGEGRYFFKDCESRNGSQINGEKIGEGEIVLSEGDKIKIGRYLFTFVFPSTLYKMLKNKK